MDGWIFNAAIRSIAGTGRDWGGPVAEGRRGVHHGGFGTILRPKRKRDFAALIFLQSSHRPRPAEIDPLRRPDILSARGDSRKAGRMPKGGASKSRRVKSPIGSVRPAAERKRARPASEPVEPPRRPARSVAMRLAEEVNRLELELAAARSRMATLETRAEIDPLTDLVNRRGLERELKRALAYVKRYGTSAVMVYLDLDGFKSVNDRHGHAAGDAVLKAVAMVLTRQVRASDLVARLGGDEFVVLLWNVPEADAAAKARSLEAAVGWDPLESTCRHASLSIL